MTREPLPPGVADLIDRRVSSTELQEALERPLTSSKREETLSLIKKGHADIASDLRSAGAA